MRHECQTFLMTLKCHTKEEPEQVYTSQNQINVATITDLLHNVLSIQ